MKANEYQELASRTMVDKPGFDLSQEQIMLSWNAVGLAGESGEVVDLIKKGIYHQQGIDAPKLKKELGDVLWYVAALCKCLNTTMEEVMEMNIEKLKARFPDGYSPERTNFKDGIAS